MNAVVTEQIKTFVELLHYRASVQPDTIAFRFLSYPATGVEQETITFQALDARARHIAQRLLTQCRPGDRALMLYPSGIDFIAAYFGCLYAGVIAVPGYPPKRNQKLGRLKSLVQDCQAKVAMTDAQTRAIAEPQFAAVEELKALGWLITDAETFGNVGGDTAPVIDLPQVCADDIAFLQYTSGSTGDPKGVMVSHGNLMANARSICEAMGHGPDTIVVGWLPLFHDMGLIGNVLQPVYLGITSTLMAPASFLQRPLRWLEAITEYRATTSGGPNFAFDLCVDSIRAEDLARLDLRSWRVAFNGAEPIRPQSLHAFSRKFTDCGFDPQAHYACYGMAETTLIITGTEPGRGALITAFDDAALQANRVSPVDDGAGAHELVSCGRARGDQGVLIVNPESLQRCADGEIGEIWAYGASNAKGYWQKPEATEKTFSAYTGDTGDGPYLRTGDLGFVHDGELYIAGRLKDVVIIRGMNHYPQDIEQTAFESHEAFMPNGAAVFAIEQEGQEKLVVVQEVRRTFLRAFDPEALARAIQEAVVLQHELQAYSIVFIKPGQLPKTSSGKVQRQACKQQYLAGQIDAIGRIDKLAPSIGGDLQGFDKDGWQAQPEARKLSYVADYLQPMFETYARLPAGSMRRDAAFIGYGLDSLTLTQIGAKLSEELDVDLQVQHLFECETVDALAAHLDHQLRDPAQRRQRIVPATMPGTPYPLSFAQQRMWFLMQYEPSALYNVSGVLRIRGDLHLDALNRSFQEIIRRHDALRTRFVEQDFEPVQIVEKELDWSLSVVDLSDRSRQELNDAIAHELNFVFNLSEDILFRATVYKEADGVYALTVCMHHIISDGWSISILMNELSALYAAYTSDQASPLAPLAVQYADYALWQREYLSGEVLARQETYWKDRLQGVAPLTLPTDKVRPTVPSHAGNTIALQLDQSLTSQLKTLSREQGATLYMTLLASFGVLLHKYSGQDDFCIGTPIANRNFVETKNLMGFFVNTLALRANYGGDPQFSTLLQDVRKLTVDAYAHQDLPFEKVVDLVQAARDSATSPLFQVMFVLQDYDPRTLTLPGVEVAPGQSSSLTSKFDITLELREDGKGLTGHLEYKTDLFDELTMLRLASHFKRLLGEIVSHADAPLSKLSLLDQDERHCLLELWNDTEKTFRQPQQLHALFARQVEATPDAVALVAGDKFLSFAELERQANRLAHKLRERGVGKDSLVALCVERSVDMVVGMIAALKAGAAYMPLDPSYPQERLCYMLKHSRASLLVIQPALQDLFADLKIATLVIDDVEPNMRNAYPDTPPAVEVAPDDTAYVIYTSGSTGRPKGVPISHAAICNQMGWMLSQYPMQSTDRMLQKTPFSFDASVWEIWAPLISGAQLVLAPADGHKDVDVIIDTIVEQKITVIQLVPALFRAMLSVPEISRISSLRRIFLGGEALPVDLAKQALRIASKVINLYGPTECSINTSYFDAGTLPENAQGYVPIGKPVSNLQCYVLDAQRELVPVGVPGELYIAGAGLSHGYLHQPELTQERFIDNPFNTGNSPKLYKTGDLVRYTAGGQLEFLARIDEQIKIRGFRIELGEIEAMLAQQAGVKASAVAVKGSAANQHLVAYVVPADDRLSLDELRIHLSRQLPEYMVPSVFVSLPAMPLNQSGKVDRKALPDPVKPHYTEFQPLSTKTEKALAQIWASILEVDDLNAKSNFFQLGGHSLLAARMVAQVRERWHIAFPIKHVFEAQELHALALLIDQAAGSVAPAIEIVARDQALPLSFAQQRLWVVNEIDANSAQYNMPAAIDLDGELNLVALERAIDAFIGRHEILRTVYASHDGVPYQVVHEAVDFELKMVDLSDLDPAERQSAVDAHARQEALTPFDLARDVMLRATLLRQSGTHHTLLVTLHHIASDGWSTTVLVKELTELYNAFVEHRKAMLPELACQYADYAAWQRKTLTGDKLQTLRTYWGERLAQLPSVHKLPLDRARPAQPSYVGGVVVQQLPQNTAAGLQGLARENGATLFMAIHAAFACLLHRYSGEADIVVGTPVANREMVELESLVGLFVNTLVVRSDFSENLGFADLLAQSKATLQQAYQYQDLPFEMLVGELQAERSQSFNPLFQIMLVFQNGEENRFAFSGLQTSAIRETGGATKFDLTLNVVEADGGLKLAWEFAKDLFDESSVKRLAHSFAALLDAAIAEPLLPVKRLPLVDESTRAALLANCNAQADDAFPPVCSHLLFERQAASTPDAVALHCNGETLTYGELNRRANQVAHYLVANGVVPDTLVGLCAERSPEMVIALLGILKAGGAYVAFDPSYPTERLRYLLEDSGVELIVTQSHLARILPTSAQQTLLIDDRALFDAQAHGNIGVDAIGLTPDSLAYIVYTSGSTGNPKASLLMHKGLSNLAQAQIEFFRVEPASRVIQFASFAFDAATSEIFMALCAGAALHLVPKEIVQSGAELSDYAASHGITHATLPPALLPVLDSGKWRSVTHLVVAGEQCPAGLLKEWAANRHFYNAYGPSEASVCSSIAELTPQSETVHIGRPMRGVQLYVLDELMQPAPVGVAGQLYVGGRGVGRGYLGRDALTREKFVASPFGEGKLYATGDLARWRADGNLEFIGRLDNQVKIRGFRIELGEVEAALSRQSGVVDSVVLVHADQERNQRLVAYLIVSDAAFSTESLRHRLAETMPGYMIPSAFIIVEKFPLTANGKLDKKRLPAPDMAGLVKVDFVAPRDEIETRLAAIWCELLGLEQVGVFHNFFDLGGHSLLAIQAISRIKEAFGVQMKVADLFVYTSIAALAKRIAEAPQGGAVLPQVAARTGGEILPLTLEQQSYWFLYELEGGTATYNIPAALRLNGRLDIDALKQSFQSLIERHESLRTILVVENGTPSQRVLPQAAFKLHIDAREENRYREVLDKQIEQDAHHVFDLKQEMPIRAVLHKLYDDDHVLTILLHHTMADGWSLDILIRELSQLYNAYSSGKPNPLPQLPVQYGDYALWQKQHLVGAVYDRQVDYWRNTLKGVPPMIDLPTDYPRPPVQSYRGREVGFVLPFELTRALNAFSRQHNTTLFNTLVAGLNVLLSRYSRCEDIAVGTAIANRSQTDLESLIGCFANTLVIRNKVEQTASFVDLVQRVNAVVFDAYEHAGVPFDAVVNAVQPERSLGVPPIFQVMFRLHNQKTGHGVRFAGVEAERLTIESESAKLDLNFSLIETDGCLEGVIEYATDLFTEKTVRRIARHFQLLLESAMAEPAAAIESLKLLSEEEFALVEEWNNNVVPYPQDECVYQLFEQSAARVPDKLAYVCGNERLSYAQLNAQANRLAHYLKNLGVGPEVRVGLSVGRSAWAGVSMLAVFKASGTYVPLDANYPIERLDIMLDVVKPKIVLTVTEFADRFDPAVSQVICLDQAGDALAAQPSDNLPPLGARHSAYILFTSGTTGRPKAILVGHRSFRNMVVAHEWAKLHADNSRVLQFASLSFSISMWDSFMAWVPGGTLYSVTQEESLPGEKLYELLDREKITHATWPVSLLSVLPVERMPSSLQTIISSAEPCNDAVVARWTARGVRFLNMYGNSEVSLGSTLYEYHKVGQKLTIGVAFPNTKMYLLDRHLRQVPIGVIAEIHTAGAGLARGYWGNPEATAKSFIPNPFAREGAERLYKTGDLGRYLPNGEIEFIGREDFQVSIRGFRVELTEIENVLRAVPSIASVVVVSQPDANQVARLVCFYVDKPEEPATDAAQLRELVARKLPSYMVPSLFVRLDAMPLTPNRKIDRLGLPKPTLDDHSEATHVAPRNALETAIAAIWSEVLGLDNLSVNRNFFEIGGHSLLAVQVVARIKDSLGLPLSIKDLFTHTTIEALAKFLAGQAPGEEPALPPIAKRTAQGRIPLSLDQKPYWFLHQLEGGSHTYNIPLAMRLRGALDVGALEQNFCALIERHESLRTLFPVSDGEPAQEILINPEFRMPVVAIAESEVPEQVRADVTHVFDLSRELPVRARLLKIDDANHVVTLVIHHVVADGWSLNILMQELRALYAARTAAQGNSLATLEPLALQYGDYSEWQHENLVGEHYNRQLDFWKQKLAGVAPLLNLPLDYPRPPIQSYRGRALPIALPFSLTAKLNQYARQHNTTLYNLLLAGLAILLSRYGRTNDIPVGTAIANRPQKELESLIGCFANTLVIRCRVDAKKNFRQLVEAVGGEALDAFANGSVPFDGVVEAVQPERSLGVPPIFQVMFRLHNQQMAQTGSFAGLTSELVEMPVESAKLDLNFSLVEAADGLQGVIEYATDIFSEQTIARIASHYRTVLEAAIAEPNLAIEKLSVVTREEMEQVRQWNATALDYPQDECMHHLFERTVERTPNKLAYVCGEDRFTYAELNARANRLAHFLQSRGVGPEVRVGVSVERSTWAGISGLAVAKAGGTYVPLDMNYPKDRIERMLDVAKPQIVLTLEHLKPLFADTGAEIIALDTGWEAIQSQPITNPARIGAEHSAYILFTSGTTGKPKGILVGHRAFRNMANAQQWAGLYSADSRVLQFASLSFSIAFWGTYMAWVPGGTLYSVASKQTLPDEPLFEFMEECQITHVTWPVSLLSTVPVERMPKSLRVVISSAEPCNDAVVAKWTALGVRFLNLYGNSEVAIGSTLYEYRQLGEKLTIGKAMPNTEMYLLDENLKQVPIGVIAEIHTAGAGLATGYVDNPEATAKSFIPNPFNDDPKSRMYKTGDLGRYLPNGEIEFIGREDFQVSIRGFRVELTEIEDVLRTVPGLLEVVAISQNDQQGVARLVCFYTQAGEASLSSAQLRQAVADRLPNYMVPSVFVLLDAMPLTPNRKVDRLALQEYPVGDGANDAYVAPRSKIEKQLAAIWGGVLDIEDIGIRHNFFELGGHSLLATKIVARIRAELKAELTLQQFFENSTIEQLADIIAQAGSSVEESAIRVLQDRDRVPLSFAQQRLWFLDRYEENSNFYHMPSVLKIVGDLNADALRQAFVTLIARHEALRTNFIASEGQATQHIHPVSGWSMEVVALEGETLAQKEAAFAAAIQQQLHTPFDLQSDSLLRVALYKFGGDEYRLFINMHHIISDGWSITVLIRELTALYTALVQETEPMLPPLPVQYADYAVWQIEYLQGPVLARQGSYWSEKLRDLSTLPLPLDFERPKNQTYHGDRMAFSIDAETLAALDALSNQQGTTLFMTLLAAFNVLLNKYSGHDDICIGTPIANRVRPEIEPLIGFFANTLVLRSDLDGDPTFDALLQQIRQTTLEAYSNQDIPFEKVVDLVLPERDASRSPLFQVSFALQKPPVKSFELPGVAVESIELENKTSKFDLLLEFLQTDDGLSGYFEYNTDLFLPQTIRSYIEGFNGLLKSVLRDPQRKLSELPLAHTDGSRALHAIALADYPILHALYSDVIAPDGSAAAYCLLDNNGNEVLSGAIGNLYFGMADMSESPKLVASGFKARQTSKGLVLVSSIDDVALIDGQLVYPRMIEQLLRRKPGIHDCHVAVRAVRSDANLHECIVAYLVCEEEEVEPETLNAYLREAGLQGVAIYACVKLASIPLTLRGAVNLRALAKYPVHNRALRQAWTEQVRQVAAVRDAVFLQQPLRTRQSVSHLHDLLPAEMRGGTVDHASVVSKARKSANETLSSVPALVMSEPILSSPRQPKILTDVLINTALTHTDKNITFYHADGGIVELSYAELLHKAQCVLTGLQRTGLTVGAKVIFQFDRNEDFVVAFWACALGGFVPVPIAPAKTYRSSNAQTVKVAHAWNMMDRAIVLAGANIAAGVESIARHESIADFVVHDISAMFACKPAPEFHRGAPNDTALIMLTSGSTGLPKGVQLTHANLIGRTLGSTQKNGFDADMVSLNWMALDHVGGIIYFHIRDTYLGAEQLQVDTDFILADPVRWLQLIDRHRVNITWAPNFAFSLIVDRKDELAKHTFDLRCLHFMLNGAEAVVPKTTQAFIELMQQFGMSDDAVKPVYGMSEISSGVTYAKRLQLTYGNDDAVFVSVGSPIPGVNLRIVDENDQLLREGQSGRLQVSGATVTKGYLGGDEVNRDVFTMDGWFKTGDLAFIENGELTITGREKNIIIINGVNFYSHEIESVVESVPQVVVSFTGACAVRKVGSGSDQLAIFFHTQQKGEDLLALIKNIRQAVIEKIGINPSYILPLEKDQIPKTEIGKIQLPKLAQMFNRGDFDVVLRKLDIAEQNDNTLPDWFFSKTWVQKQLPNVAVLPSSADAAEITLVFADPSVCVADLGLPGRVLTVVRAQHYRESGDEYRINPSIKEHYAQLVASLQRREIVVSRVLNLWDVASSTGADKLLARAPLSDAVGMYSAWYLAQAFAGLESPPVMRWTWCGAKAQQVEDGDAVNPDKTAVIALLKTLSKEFAWLTCHHIDLEADDLLQGTVALGREIGILHADEEVAYRQGKRLAQRLRRESLAANDQRTMPIVTGGAYLISGGLGGIGFELAKLLLKQFGAKLLLIGRTPAEQLSAVKQDMLESLQKLGSVRYAAADICNQAQIESAVDRAEGEWKQKLAGVFHLAGLAHEEAMAGQSIQSLHEALRAKTAGTRALYKICDQRTNTLFVNFSSINGFFGGSGMAAYNIGNRYQVAFVEAVRHNRNVNSFCISWSLWHDTGMGAQYKAAESLSRALGFRPIPAAKGMLSLLAALVHGKRDVLVGLDDTRENIGRHLAFERIDLPRLVCCFDASQAGLSNELASNVRVADAFGMALQTQFVQVDGLPRSADGAIDLAQLRNQLAGSNQAKVEKVAPRDELEETLAKIAGEIFGASEPVGIRDNFFDVGATSLLIVKLHHEIQQQLGVEFPMVELFNSTTVEKLASFLGQQGGQEPKTSTADAARAAGQDRRAAMQRRNRSRERKGAR